MVLVTIFLGIGLLVHLVLPRWWTLVCVPPAVVVLMGLGASPLPAGIHWWIAFVAGASAAVGIGLGLLFRRLDLARPRVRTGLGRTGPAGPSGSDPLEGTRGFRN